MKRLLTPSVLVIAASTLLAGCSLTSQLTQVNPEQVKDKTWVLISANNQPVPSGSRVTLELRPSLPDQGRINGRAQCNNYFGGYRVADSKIHFTGIGSTRMACPIVQMNQEKQYFDLLPSMDYLTIKGNELTLSQQTGSSRLMYAAESETVRGEVMIRQGRVFPAGSEIILKLQERGSSDASTSTVVGLERMRLSKEVQGSFKYVINYAPQRVKSGVDYELSAQVLQRGRVIYASKVKPVVRLQSTSVR